MPQNILAVSIICEQQIICVSIKPSWKGEANCVSLLQFFLKRTCLLSLLWKNLRELILNIHALYNTLLSKLVLSLLDVSMLFVFFDSGSIVPVSSNALCCLNDLICFTWTSCHRNITCKLITCKWPQEIMITLIDNITWIKVFFWRRFTLTIFWGSIC